MTPCTARRTRRAWRLVAAALLPLLLLAHPRAEAQAASPAADPPVSGTLEASLVQERSQFNIVRIDDAALLVSEGRSRSTETLRHLAGSVSAHTACGSGVVHCTATASLDSRRGQHRTEADTGTAHADAGLQWRLAAATIGARLQREQWRVAGDVYRREQGLAADAALAIDDKLSAYVLANLTTYRHPGDGAALDARHQALTGNLRLATGVGWNSVWTTQATVSRERNLRRDRAFDSEGLMLRLAWEATPAPAWELQAGVIAQGLRFAAFDSLLGVRRSDRYTGIDLSLTRRIAGELKARLEWNRSVFRSRAKAFDNDSDSLGLSLGWSF